MDQKNELVKRLYDIEREYQKCCFGDYKDIDTLNLASFLEFIETYLKRAKEAYSGPWSRDTPDWMVTCNEMKSGNAPIKTYEELIKVFALAGAVLETYTTLKPENWRKNPDSYGTKWKKEN